MSRITLEAGLRVAVEAIAKNAEELNRLDAVAGDGDLGITMSKAAVIVTRVLDAESGKSAPEVMKLVGIELSRGVPSTAGTLLAVGFIKASQVYSSTANPIDNLAQMLRAGMEGMRHLGKAELGDKTMLDVLYPICDALDGDRARGLSLEAVLPRIAELSDQALASTAQLEPRKGRASWMAAHSMGNPDGGCYALVLGVKAVADLVRIDL